MSGDFHNPIRDLIAQMREDARHRASLAVEAERERKRTFRDSTAIVVALLAALFAAWQGYEAHAARVSAREEARLAREQARSAAKAAQESADTIMALQAKLAEQSAHEAKRSADAAERSNALAQKALQITEAPFLDVLVGLGTEIASPHPVRIEVTLKNVGRTPAFNVSGWSRLVMGHLTEDEAHRESLRVPNIEMTRIFLAPAAAVKQIVSSAKPLEVVHAEEIKAGKLQLFSLGSIHYTDVFNHRHQTDYCFHYDPAFGSFNACTKFNQAH